MKEKEKQKRAKDEEVNGHGEKRERGVHQIMNCGSCYKSLVYSIRCNACKQYTQTLKITGKLQHSVH